MRGSILTVIGVLLTCASGLVSAKHGEEHWSAFSKTAYSITGDIVLSPTRLQTERANFRLKFVADLPRYESVLGPAPARVLAVIAPRDPSLLNGNKLCSGLVRWMVASHTASGELELDVFEGKEMPTSSAHEICGALFY